jgi:hypothetical protein
MLILASCKSSETASITYDSSKITLERSPCYGTCPVYKIELNGSGAATLENTRHVDPIGSFTGTLDSASVNSLFSYFANTKWDNYSNHYDANVSDLPTTTLSWYHCGFKKEISIRTKHPEELDVLIRKIDQVRESIVWSVPEN